MSSREFGQLYAHEYRVGDRVIGDDGIGGTAMGVVSRVDRHEVVVRWDDEDYDETYVGNVVSAAWVRLWPASAQTVRLQARLKVVSEES